MKLSGFTQHLVKRPPGAAKQQVVQLLPVSQNERRKLVREREDHLKVVDARQQQLSGLL